MKIDELIEKLKELRKEHGNLEVILWTQRDAWSYDMHKIDMIYQDNRDNLIVIQGKEKKTEDQE